MSMSKRGLNSIAVCAATLLLAVPSREALAENCVKPDGSGGCFTSIQGAVDAAVASELIRVFPGTYDEEVIVNTPGVQIVGQGTWARAVVVRPIGGTAFSLNASQVMLQNVMVSDATDGIVVAGPGVSLVGVSVFECTRGITVSADSARIDSSTVRLVQETGVKAAGADFSMVSSLVHRAGGNCVEVAGERAGLHKNRILDCGGDGISISGDDAKVTRNDVQVAKKPLVHIVGPRPHVSDNTLVGGRYNAMYIHGDSPVITRNFAQDCDSGIDVRCDECQGGQVSGNTAKDIYYCPGFDITANSPGLVVRNNTALHSSDEGFRLSGAIVVRGNKATYNGKDGFAILSGSSDVLLVDNRSDANVGNGFNIQAGATGTTLRKNSAHRNGLLDFYDAGTGTVLATGGNHNRFGTMGGP